MLIILNLFLPLLILITILYFLSSFLNQLTARYLSRSLYLFLMWPGVVAHELSHFVGCLVTFTKVKRVSLFHPHSSGNKMVLGEVVHEYTKNPIKKVVISLAPLFGVSLFILVLIKLLLPGLYMNQLAGLNINISGSFGTQFWNYFSQYFSYYRDLWQSLDFFSWQTYLFIYLSLSLGSHIAPSKTDLKYTFEGLGVIVAALLILLLAFRLLDIEYIWQVFNYLSYPIYQLNSLLGYGIVFTLLMLAVVLLVGGVRGLIHRL